MRPEPLLQLSGVESGYGDVQVLWGIDASVAAGTIVAVIGSNGAGKTTLMKTISGQRRVRAGEIRFKGKRIDHLAPHEVLGCGIAHVPEGRRLFRGLTVQDNLLLGAYLRKDRKQVGRDLDAVYELFPILKERQKQDATTMSGGQQQMCAIARGIMSRPELLLIDELSLGLAPQMVERLSDALVEINRRGLTILLVEQDVITAFELAHDACVIETGRVTLSGTTKSLSESPEIRRAYLGM